MVSALQIMQAMRRHGRTLADLLAGVELYPQRLVNVRIAAGSDWKKNPRLAAETDSVSRELGPEGRVLVRASGTEPVLRVMVEARDPGLADSGAQRLAAAARS